MRRVVLQPAGSGDARVHYIDTIEHPVPLPKVIWYLPKDQASFVTELYFGKAVPVWGVTAGKGGVNIRKWQSLSSGDIALFSGNGRIFSAGEISYTFQNRELALDLWKTNEDGETWEYIYLLNHMRDVDIPYATFNKAAGYALNNIIQGFTVLDEAKSANVLEALSISFSPSAESFDRVIKELDSLKVLDAKREALVRTEQAFVRAQLFAGKQFDDCCICGRSFPLPFLIAAHIKRRSECSIQEKKHFTANVVPMCGFGCDDLFERGYIYVSAGKVRVAENKSVTKTVAAYLESVRGNNCPTWSKLTQPYFRWHAQHAR